MTPLVLFAVGAVCCAVPVFYVVWLYSREAARGLRRARIRRERDRKAKGRVNVLHELESAQLDRIRARKAGKTGLGRLDSGNVFARLPKGVR